MSLANKLAIIAILVSIISIMVTIILSQLENEPPIPAPIPAPTLPPPNQSDNCPILRNNVVTILQDIKTEEKVLEEIEDRIEENQKSKKRANKNLELIEGFLNERTMSREMRAFATSILEVEKKHIGIYGEDSISANHSSLKAFKESLEDSGYPKESERMHKRHLYQAYNLDQEVYMIFDFMPKNHQQIKELTDALFKAANETANGEYSDRLWRLGGWNEKFVNSGAAKEIEQLKNKIKTITNTSHLLEQNQLNSTLTLRRLNTRISGFESEFTKRKCIGKFPLSAK